MAVCEEGNQEEFRWAESLKRDYAQTRVLAEDMLDKEIHARRGYEPGQAAESRVVLWTEMQSNIPKTLIFLFFVCMHLL